MAGLYKDALFIIDDVPAATILCHLAFPLEGVAGIAAVGVKPVGRCRQIGVVGLQLHATQCSTDLAGAIVVGGTVVAALILVIAVTVIAGLFAGMDKTVTTTRHGTAGNASIRIDIVAIIAGFITLLAHAQVHP